MTAEEIIDAIVRLGAVLDEQNVPDEGRYLIAPEWWFGIYGKISGYPIRAFPRYRGARGRKRSLDRCRWNCLPSWIHPIS